MTKRRTRMGVAGAAIVVFALSAGDFTDGRIYETEFHVFRAGEQLRATNVVYWLPVGRTQSDCKHEPGHVECGMTASPPSR